MATPRGGRGGERDQATVTSSSGPALRLRAIRAPAAIIPSGRGRSGDRQQPLLHARASRAARTAASPRVSRNKTVIYDGRPGLGLRDGRRARPHPHRVNPNGALAREHGVHRSSGRCFDRLVAA
jgi:hypothetical protein